MNACPNRAQLESLLAERLSEAEVETLEGHVAGCPDCQETLEKLTGKKNPAAVADPTRVGEGTRKFLEDLKEANPLAAGAVPAAAAGPAGRYPPAPTLSLGPRAAATPGEWPSVAGYEILGELGRGGMGVVYKARQVQLDRLVALKMILAGVHAGPQELARFRTEAEAIARIQHPNIVQIFDVGAQDGCAFFSLELVESGSLARRLAGTPLPPRRAAELVHTLARGIEAAHQQGIVHRDLKPANVLLTPDGIPKITDFGLAKRLDAQTAGTQTGVLMGTPEYMAPEQATGKNKEIGPATDVYALGVILYELLTGRPPFKGETALDTLRQTLSAEPVPPARLQPKVPRDLETICLKCLQKEAPRRYGSAAALADDLQRFLDGRPILARPVSWLEHGWRWCRRNPAVAALIAAVVLLFAAGLSFSWYFALQAEARARDADAKAKEAKQKAKEAKDKAKEADDNAERERQEKERARSLLYVARMAPLPRFWEEGECSHVRGVLREQQPRPGEKDLRRWEWHYQWRLAHGALRTLTGHSGGIVSVAFSPDGRWLASGSWDKTVKVWDLVTGQPVHTLKGHNSWVRSVAFSPDGRRLVSASTLMMGRALVPPSTPFSPDGQRLFLASTLTMASTLILSFPEDRPPPPDPEQQSHGTVKVWDVAGGKELHSWRTTTFNQLALSPDGQRLALAGTAYSLDVLDATNGKQIKTWKAHDRGTTTVAFSPDGRWLASAGGDKTVKLWDAATGQALRTFTGHTAVVQSVAFSPDGQRLVSGGGERREPGELKLWNVNTGQELRAFKGHTDWVESVAFSPDGRRLASIAEREGSAKIWDADSGRLLLTVHHSDRDTNRVLDAYAVAFSPDGQRLATACGGAFNTNDVKVWDVGGGPEMRTLKGHKGGTLSVAFSPDGQRLASVGGGAVDRTVKIWDVVSGREQFTFTIPAKWFGNGTLSQDWRRLAAFSGPGTVSVWDVAKGQGTARFQSHFFRERGFQLGWAAPGRTQRE